MMHEAGKVHVKGREFDALVDEVSGDWVTYVHTSEDKLALKGKTRDALTEAIRRWMNKAKIKIEVPFTYLDTHDKMPRNGVATGIHNTNRNILVRWDDDGSTSQISGYQGNSKTSVPLTVGEAQWYHENTETCLRIARELEAFRQSHKIDLRDAVRKATEASLNEVEDDA